MDSWIVWDGMTTGLLTRLRTRSICPETVSPMAVYTVRWPSTAFHSRSLLSGILPQPAIGTGTNVTPLFLLTATVEQATKLRPEAKTVPSGATTTSVSPPPVGTSKDPRNFHDLPLSSERQIRLPPAPLPAPGRPLGTRTPGPSGATM